ARRADARESLGSQEPLAPLALAPLLLLAAERTPLDRLALALRQALLEILVVRCARVLVGEHLVGGGQLLEGAREERRARAHFLAEPRVGGVAAVFPLVGPGDVPAVSAGGD